MTILEYKRYKKKSMKSSKRALFFGKLKRNRKKKAKKGWKAGYILAGISLLVAMGFLGVKAYSFFTTSPIFRVREFKVVKEEGLNDFEFGKLSALEKKSSMFTLDLEKTASLIGKNPWVKDVSLKKVFPGKLLIILKKRVPEAMVNLDGLYFVDGGGKVFKKVTRYDTKVYPVITGFTRKKLKASNYKERLSRALELRAMIKGSRFEGSISEINYHVKEGMSVIFKTTGLRVKLGYKELPSSFSRLKKHFDKISRYRKRTGYVDLRYPGKIIVGQKEKL